MIVTIIIRQEVRNKIIFNMYPPKTEKSDGEHFQSQK